MRVAASESTRSERREFDNKRTERLLLDIDLLGLGKHVRERTGQISEREGASRPWRRWHAEFNLLFWASNAIVRIRPCDDSQARSLCTTAALQSHRKPSPVRGDSKSGSAVRGDTQIHTQARTTE